MRKRSGWFGAALALVTTATLARPAGALELPFKRSALSNGLTVIVHEDHTLPLVAVNLLYDVGSQDEQPGRTGFAHLFEHLMFMGTQRAPTKMFDAWMEAAGGSNNAWTSEDFTDYHEVGPPGLLPLFLWLEGDRMQKLGPEIDQAKLELQRDVVLNERRQSIENVPYGKVELALPELAYPAGHPYHHPVIGAPEDLKAAAVDDVRAFFARYYVPANASLVVAGDVNAAEVESLAERSFGFIPAGRKAERAKPGQPPPLGRVIRETLEDKVELPKLVFAFRSPPHFAPGDADLDLLASALSTGKSSRLYQALVYDHPIAQTVSAQQASDVLTSLFEVEVVLRPGVSLDDAEKAVFKVLADIAGKPPTEEEIRRAKNEFEYGFVDRLQSLAARARLLNLYQGEVGDPGFVNQDLERYRAATPASVAEWAKKTLTLDSCVALRVVPEKGAQPPAPTKRAPKAAPRGKK